MSRKLIEDYIPFAGYEIIDDIDHINESAQSEVAASKGAILAIVKGPHFVPNGISRNRRNYRGVWAEAGKDEDVKIKVKNCQMLGRIGHEAEMTDMDVAKGEFSHYTRNIDWDTGIAESVILNTPMGNTLLTLLRAKVTMYVSSRADGDYCGKDEDGNDIMDPKTYKLERFDFVQDPGFLEAHPKMVTESKQANDESLKESIATRLLEVAHDIKAPLQLDGSRYMVESITGTCVVVHNIAAKKSESLQVSDFTEVLDSIQSSICAHCTALEESVETLRFANKEGLDESYVLSRRKVGESFETIAQARPAGAVYKIAEAHAPENESFNTGIVEDEPYVARLFG